MSDDALVVGGSVTLTALMEAMHSLVKALPVHQTCTFRAMLEQLKYFAGVQIRNAASVAGNICTGSPISDVNPIYMACGATFTAVGKGTPEHQASALAMPCNLPPSRGHRHGWLPTPVCKHCLQAIIALWLRPVGSSYGLSRASALSPHALITTKLCSDKRLLQGWRESRTGSCCRVHPLQYQEGT